MLPLRFRPAVKLLARPPVNSCSVTAHQQPHTLTQHQRHLPRRHQSTSEPDSSNDSSDAPTEQHSPGYPLSGIVPNSPLYHQQHQSPPPPHKRPPVKSSTLTTVRQLPNPRDYNSWVVDAAGIIPDQLFEELNTLLDQLHQKYRFEMAIVTCRDIDPTTGKADDYARPAATSSTSYDPSAKPTVESLRHFTTELFNHWRIGNQQEQNGCLMLIHLNLRRIEVITGSLISANGCLSGSWLAEMQRNEMVPLCRDGDYASAIRAGTQHIAARVSGYYTPSLTPGVGQRQQQSHNNIADTLPPPTQQSNSLISRFSGGTAGGGGGVGSGGDGSNFQQAFSPMRKPLWSQRGFQLFLASIAAMLGLNYYQTMPAPITCKRDGSKMQQVNQLTSAQDCSQYIAPPTYGNSAAEPSASPQQARKKIRFTRNTDGEPVTEFDTMGDAGNTTFNTEPSAVDQSDDLSGIDVTDHCSLQTQLLSPGQQTELQIGSRQFGVYQCSTCSHLQAAPLQRQSIVQSLLNSTPSAATRSHIEYNECRNCHYLTAATKVIPLSSATRMSDGREQVFYRCAYCYYTTSEYRVLPRYMERTYYPGTNPNSGSGEGSSFGGGSSTGTGAGSSF